MSLSNNFPSQSPSLLLDFANTKQLDSRVSFTRTTAARYYDGVTVAKAEENLLLQSQAFNEAVWTKQSVGSPITPNTEVAPDGTTTAESIILSAGAGIHAIIQNASAFSDGRVASLFVKAGTHPYIQIAFNGDANPWANFDVTSGAGAVGSTGSNQTASIVDAGNGWYRCIVYTASTTATNFYMTFVDSTTATRLQNWTALGTETVFVWGAQLEQRSAVTAYTPTTTQPITNYIPVLLAAPAGVARFDHNPTNNQSLGLLIEEQRTNLLLQSEDFTTTWITSNTSVTQNNNISPNGTATADNIIENTANAGHSIGQVISFTSGTVYTSTVYAKQQATGSQRFLQLTYGAAAFSGTPFVNFNLSTGVVSQTTGGNSVSGTIQSVGNGWYRCSITATADGTASSSINFVLINSGTAGRFGTYTGDGYSGLYLWGAQLEAGAFPTSYIPTVASQQTRNADIATMTGTNFSSWYDTDEGTVYAEASTFELLSITKGIFSIGDATLSFANRTRIDSSFAPGNNGRVTSAVNINGVSQASLVNTYTQLANTYTKVASAYKQDDFGLSTNALTPQQDSSGNIPIVTSFSIGSLSSSWANAQSFLNGHLRKIAYYQYRLSNAQLQALTS